MANMRFSELTTASSLTDSDIFALAKLDGSSESGYMSYKATLTAIAIYLNKLAVYSSDLDTNDKHIIGAINELKRRISLIPQFNIVKVQVLPTEDISDTTIYLLPSSDPQTQNVYDEFIHIDNAWEQVGSTAIDLSDYYTKAQIDGFLATKANTADVTAGLALKENKADMQTDVKEIIESCYEEKTVTGNPITVKTISGSNAKSLTVTMNPIQDLNGYDYPWVGGAGKNKINCTVRASATTNGITSEVKANNKIVASGTSTGNGDIAVAISPSVTLRSGTTYTFSLSGTDTRDGSVNLFVGTPYTNIGGIGTSQHSKSFTPSSDITCDRIMLRMGNGRTITLDANVMIEEGSTATSYAPYSNICPISGRTEVNVYGSNKNMLKVTATSGGIYTVNSDGTILADGTSNGSGLIIGYVYIDKTTEVTITGCPSGGSGSTYRLYARLVSNPSTPIAGSDEYGYAASGRTFTVSEPFYVFLRSPSGVVMNNLLFKPMIRLSSEADYTFEPYQGHTYNSTFGQTVFGGKYDFTSGVLTVDKKYVDLGSLNWTLDSQTTGDLFISDELTNVINITAYATKYDYAICENYALGSQKEVTENMTAGFFIRYKKCGVKDANYESASAFKTAMNGVKMVYKIATPIEITLTPEEIELLKGQNVLSTNADDMELSYQEIPDITPLVQYVQTLEARIKALEEAE